MSFWIRFFFAEWLEGLKQAYDTLLRPLVNMIIRQFEEGKVNAETFEQIGTLVILIIEYGAIIMVNTLKKILQSKI